MRRVVLGTRGSDLARAQTSLVETALKAAHPGIDVVVEIITTRGDEKSGANFQLAGGKDLQVGNLRHGLKGLFTGEIERALRDGEIDVAVHSAKDLPSEPTAGLEIGGVLPRAPVEDLLIAKSAPDLRALGHAAAVATGSVRRQHQLRWSRPDLQIVALRGNVPTRLRKLAVNTWDAIILARAGLERLGFDCAGREVEFEDHQFRTSLLPRDKFLPAGGQGVVAMQIRSDDESSRRTVSAVNHQETFLCLGAEREFLRRLEGDCGTPVGVLAAIQSGWLELRAQVFHESSVEPKCGQVRSRITDQQPEAIAAALFQWMYGEKN